MSDKEIRIADRLENVMDRCLQQGIEERVFPGGVVSVDFPNGQSHIVYKGKTSYDQSGVNVDEKTIYDLASLTKVVVTLPSILLSVQSGRLSLIDSITKYIPELSANEDRRMEKITIFHLLTHTSGLPAWRPFFITCRNQEDYIKAISGEDLVGDPGQQVVYSDLGFMLLGFILERVWNDGLDQIANNLIFNSMGMHNTTYRPIDNSKLKTKVFAPTEAENQCELKMSHDYMQQKSNHQVPDRSLVISSELIDSLSWREGLITGTVHDCNAYYGLNGISGHAGLFSNMTDLRKYMTIWNEDSDNRLIDPLLRKFATSLQTSSLAPVRALGWEHSSTAGSPAQVVAGCSGGDLVSNLAFGHTGFTGTSIWHDPLRKATIITLTNRVHPQVTNGMIGWRRSFHNQILSKHY